MAKRSTPPTLAAYRLDVSGEEIVLFHWESEATSAPLSQAETEVLELLLEGKTNRAIATARSTSVRTVANQVAALLQKLGAGSRFELMGRLGSGK